jgi:hypothetical protein
MDREIHGQTEMMLILPAMLVAFLVTVLLSPKDGKAWASPPNRDIWGAAGELPSRFPNKNIWG